MVWTLSSNFGLIWFIVSEILRFLYLAVLAGKCLFTANFRTFGGVDFRVVPPNDVIYRPDPPKNDHPCAESRRFSHKAWKSVQRFDLGACPRKIQDRTVKTKSQWCYISPMWGEVPTQPICARICTGVVVLDIITCAKFQIEIFRSYGFTGANVWFSYWLLHGPYNSAALMSCLWSYSELLLVLFKVGLYAVITTLCLKTRHLSFDYNFGLMDRFSKFRHWQIFEKILHDFNVC